MTQTANDSLIDAIRINDPILAKRCIKEGADPNYSEDESLMRPIHYATIYNAIDIIDILVMAGADLNATTKIDGLSPLEMALEQNQPKVHQRLQQHLILTSHLATLQQ